MRVKRLAQNTVQHPRQGLEAGLLDPRESVLTVTEAAASLQKREGMLIKLALKVSILNHAFRVQGLATLHSHLPFLITSLL